MENGYQQFFKKAKQARTSPDNLNRPKISKNKPKAQKKVIPHIEFSNADLIRETYKKQLLANRQLKKEKHKTPWKFLGVLTVLTLLVGWGWYDIEGVERLISQVDVGFLSKTEAKENSNAEAAKTTKTKEVAEEKSTEVNSDLKQGKNEEKKNWTQEDVSYFSKLADRKEELDAREQELAKLESELQEQKVEIEKRISELKKVRGEISGILNEKVNIDQEKVAKLVELYSNMKPKQAAVILENINEDLAVEILGQMKKKNAAGIMNLLKPSKAQNISEKFAGYKRR